LKKFGKTASKNIEEFTYRARLFRNFVDEMNRHNSDETQSWKMGINQFSDLTQD
jgi:hypothetical protein